MDLEAFANIGDLSEIAKKNNIEVPRLRGYRLMKDESPVPMDGIFTIKDETHVAEDLICSCPRFCLDPCVIEYSRATDRLRRYYLVKDKEFGYSGIRWERIHGRHRKTLKWAIKQKKRRYEKQYNTFNKYVGLDDVLYIHARIGGGNWPYYHSEVDTKTWFIEKVDDAFDSTYCDIYAKIDPRSVYNEK